MENAPPAPTSSSVPDAERSTPTTIIQVDQVNFSYDRKVDVLRDISLDIYQQQVTAFIGPSGCGKSTLLRCFNRMNDLIPGAGLTGGTIRILDTDIHCREVDVIELRKHVGMVFQKSNPFPKSIYENLAYGLRIAGEKRRDVLDHIIEESLRKAALWNEVKDRLQDSALGLSGGQQQRLCIARAIAVKPRILLMDEPCSALDPIATAKVEELISQLKQDYTIVIVTHNMQQATRVSDRTAFFYLGKLIEIEDTQTVFSNPSRSETEDYISGRFG